jgi:hypothetical protein
MRPGCGPRSLALPDLEQAAQCLDQRADQMRRQHELFEAWDEKRRGNDVAMGTKNHHLRLIVDNIAACNIPIIMTIITMIMMIMIIMMIRPDRDLTESSEHAHSGREWKGREGKGGSV